MKFPRDPNRRSFFWLSILSASAGVLTALAIGLLTGPGSLVGQATDAPADGFSPVFTTAHRSAGDAVRHFLGLRDEPVQPIPFTHRVHVEQGDLQCSFCHDGVTIGPVANIPSIQTCMFCHTEVAVDRASIQLLTAYWDRGEEPVWDRVYGWEQEDHVRFNHAPHVNRGVECSTCHGDVASMTVAERAVEHTMGFCMNCHEQEQASVECITCHY
jgi:hypothetical protein